MLEKIVVLLFILKVIISSRVSFDEPISDNEVDYSTIAIAKGPILVRPFKFYQRLDHYNNFDNRKFIQNTGDRYIAKGALIVFSGIEKLNATAPIGPAFLFINGAYSLDKHYGYGFPNTSLAYAQNLSAICFSLEHRFYSKTMPINGSLIHYLRRAQALADIQYFIRSMTEEFHLPNDIKWIIFGCSYAGNLAAIARMKYKDLIFGAVASSALLLSKVDYYEYEHLVEESLNSYDTKCVESITLGFEELAHLGNSTQDINNFLQLFKVTYDDLNIPYYIDNIKTFMIHIMLQIISGAVQDNDTSPLNIPAICGIMMEYSGTKLEAFAEISHIYWTCEECRKNAEDQPSLDGPYSSQDEYTVVDPEDKTPKTGTLDGWAHLKCSEFGHFSSSSNTSFLSGVHHLLLPIEKQIEVCQPSLGPNFTVENLTDRINHMNSEYGGLNFNVSNTIFIHGSLDPWYRTGLFEKLNNSLYESIFIKGTSHCTDINSPKDKDIPELKNARNKVLKILRSWIEKKNN